MFIISIQKKCNFDYYCQASDLQVILEYIGTENALSLEIV